MALKALYPSLSSFLFSSRPLMVRPFYFTFVILCEDVTVPFWLFLFFPMDDVVADADQRGRSAVVHCGYCRFWPGFIVVTQAKR